MVGNLYFESIIEALYKKKYKLLLTISNRIIDTMRQTCDPDKDGCEA